MAAGLRTALRLAVVVVFLAPLALVLAGSLRRVGLPPPAGLDLLPADPSLSSYTALGETVPLGRLLRNSLLVVAVAVPVSTLVASWAGFSLAQLPARWCRSLVVTVLVLLLVPLLMFWVTCLCWFLQS